MKRKPEVMNRQDGSGREGLILNKDAVEDILILLMEQVDAPESVVELRAFLERHDKIFEKGMMLYAYKYPEV